MDVHAGVTSEVRSPCPDFRVLAFKISGRDLFEAYRIAGQGSLYSITTGDLAELQAVLREACGSDSGDDEQATAEGMST
jgi:hypothetical protein